MRNCASELLLATALSTLIYGCAVASGQTAPEASLEVATVRIHPSHDICNSVWSRPGIGSFSAECVKLPLLIHMAFDIEENQMKGREKWMDSETFDVVAKPAGHISLTREELKPVLQQLLKERFHFAAHNATELTKGYALVIAKGGPKVQPSRSGKPPGYRVYVGPGRLEGLNWSMPFLASALQIPAGLPVVDKTGLSGGYDITLHFAPKLEEESSLPSLFTALQDALGLKLRSEKVIVPVLVIDHADKTPTEN